MSTVNPSFVFAPELPQNTVILPLSMSGEAELLKSGFIHKLHLTSKSLNTIGKSIIEFDKEFDITSLEIQNIRGSVDTGWEVSLPHQQTLSVELNKGLVEFRYAINGVNKSSESINNEVIEHNLLSMLNGAKAL